MFGEISLTKSSLWKISGSSLLLWVPFCHQQAGSRSLGELTVPCKSPSPAVSVCSGTHWHLCLFLILVIEYPPRRKKGVSRSGAWVPAKPSRVPPASWVMGGRLWPGLSVPATPCRSSNTLSVCTIQVFKHEHNTFVRKADIHSHWHQSDIKGERKERFTSPFPQPTCACISQGATSNVGGVDFSIFPPGCLSLLFWFYYLSVSL